MKNTLKEAQVSEEKLNILNNIIEAYMKKAKKLKKEIKKMKEELDMKKEVEIKKMKKIKKKKIKEIQKDKDKELLKNKKKLKGDLFRLKLKYENDVKFITISKFA